MLESIIAGLIATAIVVLITWLLPRLWPIRRIVWRGKRSEKMLTAAMEVYGRLPEDLQDDPDRIIAWLKEEARTTMWHEIFLIHGPMQNPQGVLYASLYPEYRVSRATTIPQSGP